jgi:holo-[acyl-carrier protein] synthase
MNVVAHGIDLVHCPRVARVWQTHGERFLARIYTPAESAYCRAAKDPVTRLAGRFACKEAVMKLLGTGWRGGVEWTDIETLPDPLGRPLVTLHGVAAELASALGVASVLISISHSGEYACASALGLAALPGGAAVRC